MYFVLVPEDYDVKSTLKNLGQVAEKNGYFVGCCIDYDVERAFVFNPEKKEAYFLLGNDRNTSIHTKHWPLKQLSICEAFSKLTKKKFKVVFDNNANMYYITNGPSFMWVDGSIHNGLFNDVGTPLGYFEYKSNAQKVLDKYQKTYLEDLKPGQKFKWPEANGIFTVIADRFNVVNHSEKLKELLDNWKSPVFYITQDYDLGWSNGDYEIVPVE